ncbi:MAG: TetR/AcrR family transcriptional regulator [Streptosporangiaceae bacterium]
MFYGEGIHAVGVDRVIAESGVAKATLYAHFTSKEELVAAYLAQASDEWKQWMRTSIERAGLPPGESVLAVFDLVGERFLEPGFRGCPFINAAAEFPGPGRVTERIDAHRARVRDLFAGLARSAGATDPESLADTLTMLYDGAMISAQLDGRPAAARDAREVARGLLAAA